MHKSLTVSKILSNPSVIQDYYIFLKSKLTCDKSLHIKEQEIFSTFYAEYFKRQQTDYLLNTKIDLYNDRIEPIHLNVIESKDNINRYISIISSISDIKIPTDILEKYLLFIKLTRDKEHDTFLNILVYTILKSNIRNFKSILTYVIKYRRRIFIACEHKTIQNQSEIEYYINVLSVALEFIERMEYKDLNITKDEYEKLIGI